MKKKLPRFCAAAVTALAIAFSFYLFFRPREVPAVRAIRGEISSGVEEDGYVQPIDDRNLYATQTARIVELPVEAGDEIVRGQTLVRMTNPDLDALLAETRAYWGQAEKSEAAHDAAVGSLRLLLADARRNLERYRRLFEAGGLARTEVEEAHLKVERYEKELAKAQAELASASAFQKGLRKQVEKLEKKAAELLLESPIDGYVLNLPVEKDQVVTTGDLLVGLAARDDMEIRSDILSDALGGVEIGQRVRITAPILGEGAIEGRIRKIYPLAEEKISPLGVAQRRAPVLITLPVTKLLRPGYEVRVFVETSRREKALILPVESIRTEDGARTAFLIERGKILAVPVRTGITDRRMVEIIEGLEEGDVVVRDASLDLREGERVRVPEVP